MDAHDILLFNKEIFDPKEPLAPDLQEELSDKTRYVDLHRRTYIIFCDDWVPTVNTTIAKQQFGNIWPINKFIYKGHTHNERAFFSKLQSVMNVLSSQPVLPFDEFFFLHSWNCHNRKNWSYILL